MLQPQAGAPAPLKPLPDVVADGTSGPGAVAPFATTQPLVQDGTIVLDRAGRLTRGRDPNTWEFTMDSDGKMMLDAPLVVLPNKKLDQLEQLITGSDKDVKLRVSGEVTQYHDRNYILLERWVQVPDIVQPLQ